MHAAKIREYVDAGFDEVYISQIGQEQDAFFDFYAEEACPGALPSTRLDTPNRKTPRTENPRAEIPETKGTSWTRSCC